MSPNTVKRILQAHPLWELPPAPATAASSCAPAVQTAPTPGQSVNVDLCFVLVEHTGALKLPAISGSSGTLMIARTTPAEAPPWYPGQVFAREDLRHAAAMQQFAADGPCAAPAADPGASPEALARAMVKAKQQAPRQTTEALKIARRQQRTSWHAARAAEAEQRAALRARRAGRRQSRPARHLRIAQRNSRPGLERLLHVGGAARDRRLAEKLLLIASAARTQNRPV